MRDFLFNIPTKIYFGPDKEKEVGNILCELKVKKVLIIMGSSFARKSGLFDIVKNALKEQNIRFKVLDGIRANPTTDSVNKGLEIAKTFKPHYLLAIGGGSVIDVAKSISVGFYYEGDPFDFNRKKAVPTAALPIGVILTISASGSEMSSSCVIQNDETHEKKGFNSELVKPVFAIENPKLTYSVDKYQTAIGVVDMMSHTLERYMHDSSEIEPADDFAECVIKNIIIAARRVMKDPEDYEGRSTLMIMSSMAHNGLTSIGKESSLSAHTLEYPLSGLYPEVPHGAGIAVLWLAWAKYYVYYDQQKFVKLGQAVFGHNGKNTFDNAMACINSFQEFFEEIGLPTTLRGLGIENPDIPKLVELFASGTGVVKHSKKPMDANVAKIIYESCL